MKNPFSRKIQNQTAPPTPARRTISQLTDDERQVFHVAINIRLLNQSLLRAQQVAISEMNPVYDADQESGAPRALRILVEGPSSNIRYFRRLLREARLSVG